MYRSSHLKVYVLITVSLLVGCAQPSRPKVSQWFSDTKTEEPDAAKLAGNPQARAERYKQLAADASGMTPEEQATVCAELADELSKADDPLVRLSILRTAGAFSTQAASGMLTAGMQDPDRDVRIECCGIWGVRGGPEAGRLLTEAVASDSNIDVRLAATRALGSLSSDDPHALEGLKIAVSDSDPAMQYRAVEALKRHTGQDYGNDVLAWREYLKTGVAPEAPAWSVAELWQKWF